MTTKLKVYGGNFDGIHMSIVAAPNQREAAKLLGITMGGLRSYGGAIERADIVAVALSEPGTVWYRPHWSKSGAINGSDEWSKERSKVR